MATVIADGFFILVVGQQQPSALMPKEYELSWIAESWMSVATYCIVHDRDS
jgi:hypothetical protein